MMGPGRSEDQGQVVSEPVRVGHMTLTETVNFGLQLRTKVDVEWQRVVNIHAALIGVMIFFAGQPEPYTMARLVVFLFYSFSLLGSFVNLRETYAGLQQVNNDIALFPEPAIAGGIVPWIKSRNYKHDARTRTGLLGLVWLFVGYLMLLPLILGRTPLSF